MKGRNLRPHRRRHASVAPTALLLSVASLTSFAGCGTDDAEVVALASAATTEVEAAAAEDDPTLAAPTATAAPATTAADTTSTTSTTSTELPATTTPPTVVVTLPTPEPPPPPRAEEPYVELGRIEIPKIGIDTTLLQGISLNTLDLGPGHWPGTALPGRIGNSVIAGHRTSHNQVFRNVDQLVPGDEVVFTTDEGTFTYLVRETTIVKPDAMYIIDQTYESTATLFACHPPGSTRERIVVHLDLQGDPVVASV